MNPITGLQAVKTVIDEFVPVAFLGGTIGDLAVSASVFLGIYIFLEIFRAIVLKKLTLLAKKNRVKWDDVLVAELSNISRSYYFLLAFYAAVLITPIVNFLVNFIHYLLLVCTTYYAMKILHGILNHFTGIQIDKHTQEEHAQRESLKKLVAGAINVTLWVLAALFLLSNFGFDISSLLAGLGIGGLAIALALQTVFGDLFATIALYFDKPFKVGDFIVVGSDSGTVDYIGLKSTRIKTLQGQELTIPNRELTNARVNNYKRMDRRRISFNIGVTYETSIKKLKKIPGIVSQIIKKTEGVQLDRIHFKEFGPYSLNFEAVYYVLNPDYNWYMDKNQEIMYNIKSDFAKEQIEMAYPMQVIYKK